MTDKMHLGRLAATMGMELVEHSPEHAAVRMPVEPNTQPAGLLHGGASAALAETAASVAAAAHAGPARRAVGIDLSITHHRAVKVGTVTASATALHLGSRLASYAVEICDDEGRLVASARLTCMIVERRD